MIALPLTFNGFTWIFGQPKPWNQFQALQPVFLLRLPLILGPSPVPAILAAIFALDSSRVVRNQRNAGKGQIIGQKRNQVDYILLLKKMYVYLLYIIYIYTVYILGISTYVL